MVNRILLCSDGSASALHAAGIAAYIGGRFQADIVLIHVLDLLTAGVPHLVAPGKAALDGDALNSALRIQDDIIERTGQALAEAGVSFQSCKELGNVVDLILQHAEERKVDLIVMGSRGLSGWKAVLLGSISENVARHAPCPVLVVRGSQTSFSRILLAYDTSAGAQKAAQTALDFAERLQADLTVLNVYEPSRLFMREGSPNPARAVEEQLEAERLAEVVAASMREIARSSAAPYTLRQERGAAGETIVEAAENIRSDLIVVGSRGLGGFQRLLLGSVSSDALRHAHCSVLVVR